MPAKTRTQQKREALVCRNSAAQQAAPWYVVLYTIVCFCYFLLCLYEKKQMHICVTGSFAKMGRHDNSTTVRQQRFCQLLKNWGITIARHPTKIELFNVLQKLGVTIARHPFFDIFQKWGVTIARHPASSTFIFEAGALRLIDTRPY